MTTKPATTTPPQRLRALTIGILLGVASGHPALANPIGPSVVHGNATFTQPDAHTLKITNTPGAIINWRDFSIGARETTRFVQQSPASRVLNRVTGGNPSEIMGRLLSNGRVFLINPSGMIFGPGSVIDTAGFLASTLDIQDRDFIAGRFSFDAGPGAGGIHNQGYIRTGPGGEIVLIAPEIENSGIIETDGGRLLLAAGRKVTLTSLDDGHIRFEVQAPDDQVVNLGELIARHGSVEVFASAIENKGNVSADSVSVDAHGRVVLRASRQAQLGQDSQVSAAGGVVDITVDGPTPDTPDAGFLAIDGRVSADGANGGTVTVRADRILASGTVSADGSNAGGRVAVTAGSRILADANSRVSASGGTGGGGTVNIHGGASLYTSGTVAATGQAGGRLELTGDEVKLAGATLDASGPRGGGDIRVGGGRAGGEGVPTAANTLVNHSTTLKADADIDGDGGTIVVWGDDYSHFAGRAFARGGSQAGAGGLVEISSRDVFDATGVVDVSAANGDNGTLVLDPKNFVIEPGFGIGASAGVGILTLVDPNPGAGDSFGNSVSTIDDFGHSLLWVMNPNDDLSGTDAGAVYAFNSVSGALRGAVVGANAGDMVGDNLPISVSGSTHRLLRAPNFDGGQGLVTTLDPASPPTGVLGTGNSLVGVGNVVYSGFGNGVVYLYNSNATIGGNANAGFATFYDVESPFTGTVSAANSLVGANANDRVGSNFPSSVSGSTRRLLNIPNFNGGQGAFTSVDPFNFTPGTVGTGNSLVGLGNASVNAFSLGNGLVVIRQANFDPGALPNAGYLTVYDVDAPITGNAGASNGLVGSSASDRVGSNDLEFVSGGTNRMLLVPNFNGGQGAVMAVDPFNFTPGTVTAADTFTGIGSAGYDNFVGSGNVLLYNGFADPAAVTDAGFVTVWNVDGPLVNQSVNATNSLVGANVGDNVGNTFPSTVSGSSKRFLEIPNFNAGQGAITTIDPFAFTPGTVGAGNSLLDVGNPSVSFIGNGLVVARNPNYDAAGGSLPAVGFVTVYDVEAPIVGTVDSANSLVGSNDSDRVGNLAPEFVSGSSKLVLEIPDYNFGEGAVTTIDPFNFQPGTISGVNSFTGTGNVTLDTFDLGSGLVVVRNPAYDPLAGSQPNTGFISVYDVDSPTVGAVGLGNSLIGSASGDRVGSNPFEFVSGGTNWLLLVPDFNGGQGAVTAANPYAFTGGIVDAASSFTGVGAASYDTFIGGGNVLLANGSVDVGGVTGAGFVSVVNVDGLPVNQSVSAANSFVGANNGDNVGNLFPSTVSGTSKQLLEIPNFNAGQGAVTTIDPFAFTPGTVGVGNSLVGTGNPSVDGFFLGGGLAMVRNPSVTVGANANAGFFTIYDLNNPFTGTVSAANSLVGANAGDQVGSTNTTFVSGSSKVILQIPNFSMGQGAVTTIDPFNFQPGTVGTGNSLVGTAGMGINSFIGGGIVQMSNASFDFGGNANVGFLTYYDVDNPFTGAVSPTTALLGSNINDSVGSHSVGFISGGSKRLLLVPNFNSGQGAVRSIDPFNFQPGTVTAANSFVGTGNTVNYTSLGGGNFLLYGFSADVGGTDRGFITKLNIDTLGSGSVSAANSLVGANDLDQVGNPFPQAVTGSTNYLLRIPNFNGGQGAVTTINTTNFTPGVVSSSNSLVGTGTPAWSFFGNGNVVLYDSFADVGGLTDNGYATVYNVDEPLTGLVSATNSLVGSFPGDRIASNGITALASGNALVRSPLADGSVSLVDSGRLDILDITGISGGSGGFTFASDPGGTVTVGAGTLSALLSSGTNLALQANNDITTLLGAFIDGTNGSATGGSLSLEAGRRITINDDIEVDGDLALLAGVAGIPGFAVQTVYREDGSGDLTITDAFVTGRNVLLAGDNVAIDPSAVFAEEFLLAYAANDFNLIGDSVLGSTADLAVVAGGNILLDDSWIEGEEVLLLAANVGLRGAQGPSPYPSDDSAAVYAESAAYVAAVGQANMDARFKPAIVDLLAGGVTASEFDAAVASGSFGGTTFETILTSLTLGGGTLSLEPGVTENADALIVAGEGLGSTILGFRECLGCTPVNTDLRGNASSDSGVWASPIRTVLIEDTGVLNVADELLALLTTSEDLGDALEGDADRDDDEEDDEDEEDEEEVAAADGDEGEGEQELQECR